MKATVAAHPIQGLKNPKQRIPYHDSISVCMQALSTMTTVETLQESKKSEITINGRQPDATERRRARSILADSKSSLRTALKQVRAGGFQPPVSRL